MTHEKFPRYFPAKDKISANKKILARKAAKIIAISENTKKDVRRFYDIDERKIEVVYLGNSLIRPSAVRPIHLPIPEKYVFFVGNRCIYKNFVLFIRSMATLMAKDKDLNIICAGGTAFSDFEKEIFKDLNLEGRIHHIKVTDEALALLYQNALAFVFPSLYEGFGIPVLEAFACGCPVVLSNSSSLPEVGGNAVVYFDPKKESSIRNAVNKVIYDEILRCNLRTKGFEQLKKFSWKKTASQTEAVYKSIL